MSYPAGWNLVALPTAQLLAQALPPLYAYGPGGGAYEQIGLGDAIGGRAIWAYFPHDVSIVLGSTASESTRVLTQPDQWAMAGNPSTSESLHISGADDALAYDAVQGYVAVDELRPGQGAWILSHSGGAVVIGRLSTASGEAAVQNAQVTLSRDPTNRSTIDGVTTATGEMIASRQYAAAQSAMDDLRSADDDGLRSQGVAQLPPLTDTERAAAAAVREDLAAAQTAYAAGDSRSADEKLNDARRAAQSSEDDALDHATAQSNEQSVVHTATSPTNLMHAGTLLRAEFLKIGLGMSPSQQVWNAVSLLLSGQPIPPGMAMPVAATPSGAPPNGAPASMTCPPYKPTLVLSPPSGVTGMQIMFSASGFPPGLAGQLSFDNTLLSTSTTLIDGTAQGTFVVPDGVTGSHTVKFVTAGGCVATATFQVAGTSGRPGQPVQPTQAPTIVFPSATRPCTAGCN